MVIHKDGACTKALIMDIRTYLVSIERVQKLLQGMPAVRSI